MYYINSFSPPIGVEKSYLYPGFSPSGDQFNHMKYAVTMPSAVEFPPDQRKTLVLDLDETLVHTSSFPPHEDVKALKFPDCDEWTFLRPKVEDFLDTVSMMFETFIFTAGTKEYADPIINKVCPQVDQLHRFYRDSCNISRFTGKCKKNLKKFGKPMSQVIMIDDNKNMKKVFPQNTIYIERWNGMPSDNVLMETIMPILVRCEKAEDVRTVIKEVQPVSDVL